MRTPPKSAWNRLSIRLRVGGGRGMPPCIWLWISSESCGVIGAAPVELGWTRGRDGAAGVAVRLARASAGGALDRATHAPKRAASRSAGSLVAETVSGD